MARNKKNIDRYRKWNEVFRKFSIYTAKISGHGAVFALSVLLILVWLLAGPIFHFSDTWQLFLNTLTSIITFLMVFVIQNSQNRENTRINLKLDELIRSHRSADNRVIGVVDLSDEDLEELGNDYREVVKGNVDSAKLKKNLDGKMNKDS